MKENLANFYLQYINEFLTISAFSDFHHIDMDTCTYLLKIGKQYHEERVFLYKIEALRGKA